MMVIDGNIVEGTSRSTLSTREVMPVNAIPSGVVNSMPEIIDLYCESVVRFVVDEEKKIAVLS